ncbi:MAG: serine/threonine protein kinase [Planctomycetes bacterium]|nr:serine/threonine protein kinase [Planctomycetota bacterium]
MTILENDGNLARATEVEGYKVLPPCVIYGKIGQGGMGAVYRGRHLNLDIDVAVKCLKPELVGGDDQFVVRFRREARAAAQINHQNVIRVFDVAENQGLHYLIMELVQGESARERVTRKGQLGIGEALEIIYGAALGLAEAHRKGFVHRDIKPDNIMISSSGQVKVADLGLAKPKFRDDNASMLSGTNLVMGTPQYMPPEQWENTTNVTAAADVWALGATLYYLLVGGEAIQKDSLPRIMQRIMLQAFPDPRRLRADVPEDVAAVVAKATSTAVADRYQDAQELADAIQDLTTRRETLRDKGAAPTSQVSNQILSPPPAKTLAKIKFWLDKQGQDGDAAKTAGPQGTMVVDGPGRTITELNLRKRSAWPWFAGAAMLLVVVLVATLGPWSGGGGGGGGTFATANRFESAHEFAAAIEETNRVHDADPSLGNDMKNERLARLCAAWAQDLAVRGDWQQALGQIERSLVHRATQRVRDQKRELLDQIQAALNSRLVRQLPSTQPLPRGAAVQFRGRLDDAVVQTLRIGGHAVDRAAGSFDTTLDVGGSTQVDVEVSLSSGDVLRLTPWSIVYEDAAEAPGEVAVQISPEVVQLEDGADGELVVRTVQGAEVRVDGTSVPAAADGITFRWRVTSAVDQPGPLNVVVSAPGAREVRRSVPVRRVARPLQWLRAPTIEGARSIRGQLVGKDTSLQLVGQIDAGEATLLVDGVPIAAEWTPQGAFRGAVTVPGPGRHALHVAVQKRFRPTLEQDLQFVVLSAPAFEFLAPTKDSDVTSAASYAILVTPDEWTTSLAARRSGVLLRTVTPQPGGGPARIDVALLEGSNELDVVAVNVVGLETTRRLVVTRLPGAAPVPGPAPGPGPVGGKPRITQVVASFDGQEQVVEKFKTIFVRSGTLVRVQSTDPGAVVLYRDRELAADDMVLQPGSVLLQEPLRCELKVRNEAGVSDVFKFGVQIDDTPPEFTVQAPTAGVGVGKPFSCTGTWNDEFGVSRIAVNGVEGTGASNGSRGTWTVELPGIDGPVDYEVVVTDRAGNRTVQSLHLVP